MVPEKGSLFLDRPEIVTGGLAADSARGRSSVLGGRLGTTVEVRRRGVSWSYQRQRGPALIDSNRPAARVASQSGAKWYGIGVPWSFTYTPVSIS